MPKVEAAKQPTIAIITSQYFEKMAVDAMMTNRQTFVRYATVGEWECAGVPLCSPAFINLVVIVLLLQVLFSFCLVRTETHQGVIPLIEIIYIFYLINFKQWSTRPSHLFCLEWYVLFCFVCLILFPTSDISYMD